jgi:hypothetical protein
MVDLMLMLENWQDLYWTPGDLNGNGYFNVIDFQIMLGQWGTLCQGALFDLFHKRDNIDYIDLIKKTETWPNQ